ncbi:MAG: sugar ABC transporter ATP-binding protein [Christensenellales bacterium]|jgi:ribose transport system ATP-binding protein
MNLRMRGIHKAFGDNQVLVDVSFALQGGEICALLGENGAGKSTLMNILGGVLPADEGTIELDGRQAVFATPLNSMNAGIAFIHQELNLVPDLAVYENMFLGRELKKKSGALDHQRMVAETQAVFARMGLQLDPQRMVRELDSSHRQMVEISRALMMDARLIIMDEPTTTLTDPEIAHLFSLLRTLKAQGVGMIFISHKLREAVTLCDRYAVLRDGHLVAEGDIADVTTADLSRFMVGHTLLEVNRSEAPALGDAVLAAQGLTAEPYFRDISFSVRAGEILGVTGLLGDGRSEVFRAVFGDLPFTDGEVLVHGRSAHIAMPRDAVALGIAYVPRDRKENGILRDLSILDNSSAASWDSASRHGILDEPRLRQMFAAQREALRIKMGGENDPITSLSGGNQQKVMLARWLSVQPHVLVLDNPTQGVDVGAKEEIYHIIHDLARGGTAIVVLSSEAAEIVRLCDRALVMFHGSAAGEVQGDTMNEYDIMRLSTGDRLADGAGLSDAGRE